MAIERIRLKNQYVFEIDSAVGFIKQFNRSHAMMATDWLLNQHFKNPSEALEPTTVAARVVLLDSLYGTRLYMENGAQDRLAASLASNAPTLLKLLQGLQPDDLVANPQLVIQASRNALGVILNQVSDTGEQYRRHYSFASKFFHWTTRRHFPIVDSRARKRINAYQTEHEVRRRVRSSIAAMAGLTYIDEYERWILFYSDLIHHLDQDARNRLLDEDFRSQPPAYRVENSLLRILDKVFYTQGGGSGMGRVEA